MAYPQYPNTFKRELELAGKTISIEIGRYSEQVSAAVIVSCGETVVHTTVALGRKVSLGYFPLSVEFAEKLYSSGTIKGSRWVKRDGRPLDDTILKARVIDRSLRPMFPDGITHEVQVVNTVFSFDGEHDPDMLGLLGSAIGLAVSDIPFDGPIAGLRIGYDKESQSFLYNPSHDEREKSELDLIVAGTGETVVMVEAGANEVAEDVVVEALIKGQEEMGKLCKEIASIVKEVGKAKQELISEEELAEAKNLQQLADAIEKKHEKTLQEVVKQKGRLEQVDMDSFVAKVLAETNTGKAEDELLEEGTIKEAIGKAMKAIGRKMIIEEGVRPDGRKLDEIRPIWCEVDVFPRTHGSAMFKRGATQAVTVTTLGSPALGQLIESIEGEETRHYIHHYNMPPYASGEAGRFGFPKRREIGHGALAERALLPMIPSQEDFPYTIHVVSEIMSSNGSTSQASVCGSTMSLMAAGVPLKRPVAGIAMGLMSDGKNFRVLSDIQGLEDHTGDMDFKVAGTSEGITAIQMDIKLSGIPRKVLEEALEQARVGRMHIMDKMLECIAEPRTEISQYAPKIEQLTIPADKIGEVIGPAGKNIKGIIEATGAEVDIDEDEERHVGIVNISSPDQDKIDAAKQMISDMVREVEVGDEFDGKVTRVESYGAFVSLVGKKEGLVHVSAMSTDYVNDASDVVKLGDEVHVRVIEIKEEGKISLSMLSKEEEAESKASRGDRNGSRGNNGGGSSRGGDRGRGGYGGSRGGDRGGRGSDRGSRGGDRGDRNSRGTGGRSGGYRGRDDRGSNRDGRSNDRNRGGSSRPSSRPFAQKQYD